MLSALHATYKCFRSVFPVLLIRWKFIFYQFLSPQPPYPPPGANQPPDPTTHTLPGDSQRRGKLLKGLLIFRFDKTFLYSHPPAGKRKDRGVECASWSGFVMEASTCVHSWPFLPHTLSLL